MKSKMKLLLLTINKFSVMTKEHEQFIWELNELKQKIQESSETKTISYLIKIVIQKALSIIPASFKEEEKLKQLMEQERAQIIGQLQIEEQRILKNEFPNIKAARIQVSTLILQLAISITGEGVYEIEKVLKK